MSASRVAKLLRMVPSAAKQFMTPRRAQYALVSLANFDGLHERECPACGYKGHFRAHGQPPRYDALCPSCGTLERHRHFWLCEAKHQTIGPKTFLLHFAPEKELSKALKAKAGRYVTADLSGIGVDDRQDITALTYGEGTFNVVIAHHVLEHVPDDRNAIAEVHRVLKPGGTFITSVPMIAAWNSTYENSKIVSSEFRTLHFGQWDHVRYYGADFADRLRRAGFVVEAEIASGAESARYGLIRGDTVFYGRKANLGSAE